MTTTWPRCDECDSCAPGCLCAECHKPARLPMRDRLARLREQQRGPGLSMEEDIAKAFSARLTPHLDHPWAQVGRCVICGPCGVRLYQGTMPDGHPVYVPPPPRNMLAEFRDRWKVGGEA